MGSLLALLLVFHSGQTPGQEPQADTRFDEAIKAAETTKAAWREAYDQRFQKAFTKRLTSAMNYCVAAVRKDTELSVLLLVQADGRIGDAMIRPEGEGQACILGQLRKSKFPKPPSASAWKKLAVTLRAGRDAG